jgi:hypothetical protein
VTLIFLSIKTKLTIRWFYLTINFRYILLKDINSLISQSFHYRDIIKRTEFPNAMSFLWIKNVIHVILTWYFFQQQISNKCQVYLSPAKANLWVTTVFKLPPYTFPLSYIFNEGSQDLNNVINIIAINIFSH